MNNKSMLIDKKLIADVSVALDLILNNPKFITGIFNDIAKAAKTDKTILQRLQNSKYPTIDFLKILSTRTKLSGLGLVINPNEFLTFMSFAKVGGLTSPEFQHILRGSPKLRAALATHADKLKEIAVELHEQEPLKSHFIKYAVHDKAFELVPWALRNIDKVFAMNDALPKNKDAEPKEMLKALEKILSIIEQEPYLTNLMRNYPEVVTSIIEKYIQDNPDWANKHGLNNDIVCILRPLLYDISTAKAIVNEAAREGNEIELLKNILSISKQNKKFRKYLEENKDTLAKVACNIIEAKKIDTHGIRSDEFTKFILENATNGPDNIIKFLDAYQQGKWQIATQILNPFVVKAAARAGKDMLASGISNVAAKAKRVVGHEVAPPISEQQSPDVIVSNFAEKQEKNIIHLVEEFRAAINEVQKKFDNATLVKNASELKDSFDQLLIDTSKPGFQGDIYMVNKESKLVINGATRSAMIDLLEHAQRNIVKIEAELHKPVTNLKHCEEDIKKLIRRSQQDLAKDYQKVKDASLGNLRFGNFLKNICTAISRWFSDVMTNKKRLIVEITGAVEQRIPDKMAKQIRLALEQRPKISGSIYEAKTRLHSLRSKLEQDINRVNRVLNNTLDV